MTTSPTVRRRRLARELTRLREEAGMTIEQAAASAGISMSHLSRVERSQVGIRLPAVKVLLTVYGADAGTTSQLIEIAKEATQRGWWQPYSKTIRSGYATFIGFEIEADQIWNFDANTMPGLLQTEVYARAMFQGGASRYSDEEIDRQVEVRMQRQAILGRENPPRLWVVLDEAVIRREVGGPAVLRDQLNHVIEIAAAPQVDVQIVPFAAGAHPGTPGSFIVLRYAEQADPPVVYMETLAGDLYPEEPKEIDEAILAFDRLRAVALGPDDSISLMGKVAKELK